MKNKQIEKIQDILPNIEVIRCMYGDTDFATYLYDHGCRQIEDNSIVMTKAEKEKLLHEMYEQGRFDAIADLEKEGKVVMSREEYDYFIKDRDYWQEQYFKENLKYIKFIGETLPELIDKKGKETAERFYNKVNENICVFKLENKSQEFTDGYIQAIADICGRLDQVAKQFNIEIKED